MNFRPNVSQSDHKGFNRILLDEGLASSHSAFSRVGRPYIEHILEREKLTTRIPQMIDSMPLSNQIKMHLEKRNRESSRSSSLQRTRYSPTKMSSLTRSPPSRSGSKKSGHLLINSQGRKEMLLYFGLQPDSTLKSPYGNTSPLRRSLHA